MNRTLFLSSVILLLTACRELNSEKTEIVQDSSVDNIVRPPVSDQHDTIKTDEGISQVDTLSALKILRTGNFHAGEVWRNADQLKWYGLFNTGNNFYLKQTTIKAVRIHDPVLDGSMHEKTGWEIGTSIKDSNIMLIEARPYLQNKVIKHVALSKKNIYPGDELDFSFSGIHYKLFATGENKNKQRKPESSDIINYKLFLRANKNGQQVQQLLVAQKNFDDKMIELLFAGDIDGDGILDFIIDTSRHYNATSPTLYLSGPANEKEIVKPVGTHTSVGG